MNVATVQTAGLLSLRDIVQRIKQGLVLPINFCIFNQRWSGRMFNESRRTADAIRVSDNLVAPNL